MGNPVLKLESRLIVVASPDAEFDPKSGYNTEAGLVRQHIDHILKHDKVYWDLPRLVPGYTFEELRSIGPRLGYILTTKSSPEGRGLTYAFDVVRIHTSKPDDYPHAQYVPDCRRGYEDWYLPKLGWILLANLRRIPTHPWDRFVTKNGKTPSTPISWALLWENVQ